jgi:hypothetical protein
MPAATLGDLHRAIKVLFDWDGDHLHAFTVADVRYSDPFLRPRGDRQRGGGPPP